MPTLSRRQNCRGEQLATTAATSYMQAPEPPGPIPRWTGTARSVLHRRRFTTIYKGSKYTDRQSESAEAKKSLLAKFQSRPAADDPAVQARAAERKAIAEARAVRDEERRQRKAEEAARKEAERQEQLRLEAERKEAERLAAIEAARAEALLRLKQKAARDARYAARKARR